LPPKVFAFIAAVETLARYFSVVVRPLAVAVGRTDSLAAPRDQDAVARLSLRESKANCSRAVWHDVCLSGPLKSVEHLMGRFERLLLCRFVARDHRQV
jgi:hypothetical protein